MTEEKIILLIGRTGQGRSTLANVLSGKENNFRESESSKSETRKIQEVDFEHEGNLYQIVDTPGIGDTSLSESQVLSAITEWYKENEEKKIQQFLFVVGERFTPEEVNTYSMLKEVFFDDDFAKHVTIIRTRFPSFEDEEECKKRTQLLLEESPLVIVNMINSCNGIIYVDSPSINIAGSGERIERQKKLNKEIREESRRKLLKHLEKKWNKEEYKPKSWKEKIERVIKEGAEKENKIQRLENQLNKINELFFPNQFYDFSILQSEIKRLKVQDLTIQIPLKNQELEQLTNELKSDLSSSGKYLLGKLLQNNENVSELEKMKQVLKEELKNNQDKLQELLDRQKELFVLKKQLEGLKQNRTELAFTLPNCQSYQEISPKK